MRISRREFVAGMAAATAVTLTAGGRPVLAATGQEAFDAGPAADLAEGLTDKFAREHVVLIVRKGNRVYAMTAACPHRGTTLRSGGDFIRCPGHGSRFDLEGTTTRGPAEGQLARHGLSLKGGRLWVDPSKIFLPGDFESEGAFVVIPG